MATIIPIGEPVNDAERAVIAHLRDHGPASWTVFHNFEIGQGGEHSTLTKLTLLVSLVSRVGARAIHSALLQKWLHWLFLISMFCHVRLRQSFSTTAQHKTTSQSSPV